MADLESKSPKGQAILRVNGKILKITTGGSFSTQPSVKLVKRPKDTSLEEHTYKITGDKSLRNRLISYIVDNYTVFGSSPETDFWEVVDLSE